MADTKISDFVAVTAVGATDVVPVVQSGANKKATAGQIRTYIYTPVTSAVTAAAIPINTNWVEVAGTCTLPAATVVGTEVKIISTAAGKISSVGLLPSDGFTFAAAGAILHVVWSGGAWNSITVKNMSVGIV